MSSAGSVSAMLSTLKNNAKALKRGNRKSHELSVNSRKALKFNTTLTKAEIRAKREALEKAKKRQNYFLIISSLIIFSGTILVVYYWIL